LVQFKIKAEERERELEEECYDLKIRVEDNEKIIGRLEKEKEDLR